MLCDGPSALRRLSTGYPVAVSQIEIPGVRTRFRAKDADSPLTHPSFEHHEQSCANASAGKFGRRIEPLQNVAANGTPSGHLAVDFGDPNLQLAKLLLHSGEPELRCPSLGFFRGHSPGRQFEDGSPPHFEESNCIIVRGRAVKSIHSGILLRIADSGVTSPR